MVRNQVMPKLYIADESDKKERVFELRKKTIFIGRSATNDIQINDLTVSRKHLKIYKGAAMNMFFIEDLNSTNGTFIGNDRIESGESFQVDEKDPITIGNTLLRVKRAPECGPLDIKVAKAQHPKIDTKEKERLIIKKERRSISPKESEFISNTSQLLKQTPDINEILEKILNNLFAALPRIDRAAILLFDNQKVQVKQVIERSREGLGNGSHRFSRSLLDKVVRDGKTIKLSNIVYESPTDHSDKDCNSQIKSALCIPMIHNSKIRGGIYLDSHLGLYEGFRKEDHLLLHRLSSLVTATIEKASLLLN